MGIEEEGTEGRRNGGAPAGEGGRQSRSVNCSRVRSQAGSVENIAECPRCDGAMRRDDDLGIRIVADHDDVAAALAMDPKPCPA